ncbi:unnamed protein product, partial [Coregonus sp. 'balchen']
MEGQQWNSEIQDKLHSQNSIICGLIMDYLQLPESIIENAKPGGQVLAESKLQRSSSDINPTQTASDNTFSITKDFSCIYSK